MWVSGSGYLAVLEPPGSENAIISGGVGTPGPEKPQIPESRKPQCPENVHILKSVCFSGPVPPPTPEIWALSRPGDPEFLECESPKIRQIS